MARLLGFCVSCLASIYETICITYDAQNTRSFVDYLVWMLSAYAQARGPFPIGGTDDN